MSILNAMLTSVVWNTSYEDTPAGSDSPSQGDDAIREVKESVRERFEKEHKMNLAAGNVAADGWHKRGSGIPYFQATEPTVRPDNVTALTSDDNGRRWVRSTDYREYVYVHPSWTAVTAGTGSANTWTAPQTFSDTATFDGDVAFNGDTTFNGTFNGGTPITEEDVNLLDAQNVKLTGDQTVAGIKTFTSIPVLPTSNPTSSNQAVRRDYVRNFSSNTSSSSSDYIVVLPSLSVGEIRMYYHQHTNSSSSSRSLKIQTPAGGTYRVFMVEGLRGGTMMSGTMGSRGSIAGGTLINTSGGTVTSSGGIADVFAHYERLS